MWWEVPGHLGVKDSVLFIADKNAVELADEHKTPLYVMNAERIRDNYHRLYDAVSKGLNRDLDIHYAVKANSNLAVLQLMKELGSYIDAVSPFEVWAAEKVGFAKDEILYTGTSTSTEDMEMILDKAVINIDSISQLNRYARLRDREGFDPKISMRINPGKGAGHVPGCMTAGEDAKYGVPEHRALEAYEKALDIELTPVGIHNHIGSGILSSDIHIFYEASEKLLDIAGRVHKELDIEFDFVDLGGGIGIPYRETDKAVDIDAFGREVANIVEDKAAEHDLGDFTLKLEPGRYLVGDSEILLLRAVDVSDKYVPELGVDGGFNVLVRPAMYKTWHEIVIANKADSKPTKKYRVSGNLCESSDVFTENKHALRALPAGEEGDVIAILNAGAYSMSMASNYNMRGIPKEIMIDRGDVRTIRERDNFEDLIRKQRW